MTRTNRGVAVVSKTRRRKIAVVLAVAAGALGLAACGGGGDDGGGDAGTVVFGANTELSGPLQVYGLPVEQGAQSGAQSVNDDGGIEVDGDSYQMEAVTEDNRSDPSQIVSASRAIVDAGAIGAVGPDLGAVPAYEVWKQNDVITFTPAFDLQAQLMEDPEGNPLLFSPTVFLAETYETNIKQTLARFPEIKSVAILSPNDEQGQGTAFAYEAAAKANGLEVVGNESYPVGTTDFTSVLTQFKGEQPDLLIAEQATEQATAILQQAVQLDVAPFALNDVMTPDDAQKVPGIDKITVILPSFGPTFSPNATIPAYDPEAIFGDEQPAGAPAAAVNVYYLTHLLAQAIEDAGSVDDTAAIAEALPGQSYDGPFGTCTMSDRRELNCETMLQVVTGDEISVDVFPDPDSTEPSATYTCRGGECEEQ